MSKQLPKCLALILVFFVTLFCSGGSAFAQSAQLETLPPLVLSELQTGGLHTGGAEDGQKEFIEVYNPSADPLDVTDWRIEYLSASHNGTGAATRTLAVLQGEMIAGGYALLSYESFIDDADIYFGAGSTSASGLLARSGGHVRIVDEEGKTIDLIGWGTGVTIGSWWKVPEVPAGSSVQRILPGHDLYGVAPGFAGASPITTPRVGGLRPPVTIPPPEIPKCSDLVLSELLPNPSGADAGKEFIEIHNPTAEPIGLKGCTLRLGESGKTFALPDEALQPLGYRVFLDTDTGITLPNTTPQAVWLLSDEHEESAIYDANLADGVSWIRDGGAWLASTQPTPGQINVLILPQPADEGTVLSSATPCPEGKERNSATGRCRTPESASEPTPCKAGQTRNPETNRCRAVATVASQTPCRPDQGRNLETNRCRSINASIAGTLQSCEEGQERNPETNRCRKIQAAATLPKVEDVATPASAVNPKLWIGGLLAASALGYAIYEWRQDILRAGSRLRRGLDNIMSRPRRK